MMRDVDDERKTFYLIRHGETKANVDRILQGHEDYPLNDHGRDQALKAGQVMKRYLSQDDPEKDYRDEPQRFHFVSSDLSRARETAQKILEGAFRRQSSSPGPGSPGGPLPSLKTTQLCRERCFGVMENKPLADFIQAAQEAGFARDYDRWIPEGGENARVFRDRASAFLEDYLLRIFKEDSEVDVIVAVSHGGFIREFLTLLLDSRLIRLENPNEKGKYCARPRNTAISKCTFYYNRQISELTSVEPHFINNHDHVDL